MITYIEVMLCSPSIALYDIGWENWLKTQDCLLHASSNKHKSLKVNFKKNYMTSQTAKKKKQQKRDL